MGVTLGGVGDPFFMLEALGVGGIQNARAGEDAIDLPDESWTDIDGMHELIYL
jgi:hypothetical protein